MKRPWYAVGARNLLESRQRGKMPDGPVLVSLVGSVDCAAEVTLLVREDMPLDLLDWRMLVNLDVWLWADGTVPLARVLQHVDRIARARPRALFLRFAHQYRYEFEHEGKTHERNIPVHDIEVGNGRHHAALRDLPDVHEFSWCPTNNAATPIGARLRKALLLQHPAFTVL